MKRSLAVLMDPIAAIHPEKDSTLAMLLEAQRRGYEVLYALQSGLAIRGGEPWAKLAPLEVRDDDEDWFTLGEPAWRDLSTLDVILARKDPPFDDQFLYDTMVLELAEMKRRARREPPAGPARRQREALFAAFPAVHAADDDRARRRRDPPFRRRARRGGAEAAGRHGRPLDLPQPQPRSEPQRDPRDADRQRPQFLRGAALHSGDHAPATSAS